MTMQIEAQRAYKDLLESERGMRIQVENHVRDLRQLLLELAVRFDGQRLEILRRDDPAIPGCWSSADWRAFFNGVVTVSSSWSAPKKTDSAAERELKQQIESLRATINDLTKDLNETQQELAEQQERRLSMEAVDKTKVSDGKSEKSKKGALPTLDLASLKPGMTPPPHILVQDIKTLLPSLPKEPPEKYKKLGIGEGRRSLERKLAIQRYWVVLRLIGFWHLSSKMEIEGILAEVMGISSGAGSLQRIGRDLLANDLLVVELIKLSNPNTHLKLYRLSDSGRWLYRAVFGRDPVESEWERLIRLHEGERFKEHTLACLLFALHARKRGWAAQVLPAVNGDAAPDVLISDGSDELFVEVELKTKERTAKWRNLADLNNGKVALCGATPGNRKRLVGDCKMDKLPGLATDLKTLISAKYKQIELETPLWVERW